MKKLEIKDKLLDITNQLLGSYHFDDPLYAIISNSRLAITFVAMIEDEFEIELNDDDIDADFFSSFDKISTILEKHIDE